MLSTGRTFRNELNLLMFWVGGTFLGAHRCRPCRLEGTGFMTTTDLPGGLFEAAGGKGEMTAQGIKRRILVVEDEMLIAMLLEDMLAELGHEVAGVAPRVNEALAAVSR